MKNASSPHMQTEKRGTIFFLFGVKEYRPPSPLYQKEKRGTVF
jgi:hypothetical protein